MMSRSIGAAAAVALIAAAPTRADVVTDWFAIAKDNAEALQKTPGYMYGPKYARSDAKVALAVFEAANAVDRKYESFLKLPATNTRSNLDAAVAAAAHRVLLHYMPEREAELAAALKATLEKIPDDASEAAGIAVGEAAAKAVLAVEIKDAGPGLGAYRPFTQPGKWVPTALPVIPTWMLDLKPWFMPRADSFRPAPPPALDSAEWASNLEEVRAIGGKNSRTRSEDQTVIAKFWQGIDADPVFLEIAAGPGRTAVRNARFWALYVMVQDDAMLAIVEGKMHYGFWRPITAIRNADEDGNDATVLEAGWEPLLNTPNHPEYPCGHCGFAWASATVLESETDPATVFSWKSTDAKLGERKATIAEHAAQTSLSRLYGGVHYRFSLERTDEMGRQAARNGLATFARPLPTASGQGAEKKR